MFKIREVKKYLDDSNINEVEDYLSFTWRKFFKKCTLKLESNFEEIIWVNKKIYKNLNEMKKLYFENIINLATNIQYYWKTNCINWKKYY